MPQLDQTPIMVEYRLLIGDLGSGVDLAVVRIHRQPRVGLGEAGMDLVTPLHRGSSIVSTAPGQRLQQRLGRHAMPSCFSGILQALDVSEILQLPEWVVRHSQLLALIDVRGSALQMQHRRQRLGTGLPEPRRIVTESRHRPGLVVILDVQ